MEIVDGKFKVTTVGIGQRSVTDVVGTFDTYEEARDVMFSKFNDDFNRPSEYAIKFKGHSPVDKVWDYSEKGRELKASISMTEGSRTTSVVSYKPQVITLRVRKKAPFILTVRDLHPLYFEHTRKLHVKRIERLKKMRRNHFKRLKLLRKK